MTRQFNLKETFQTKARRRETTVATLDSRSISDSFNKAHNGNRPGKDKPGQKPETTQQRNLRLTAEKKLRSLSTTGTAVSAGSITARKKEITELYAAAGTPAPKGSKLEQRIEKAARRAHYVSAEKKLSGFMAPDAAHNSGTTRFFEAEVREHYAASGNIVARGSRLDQMIESAVKRNTGYALSGPSPA